MASLALIWGHIQKCSWLCTQGSLLKGSGTHRVDSDRAQVIHVQGKYLMYSLCSPHSDISLRILFCYIFLATISICLVIFLGSSPSIITVFSHKEAYAFLINMYRVTQIFFQTQIQLNYVAKAWVLWRKGVDRNRNPEDRMQKDTGKAPRKCLLTSLRV